MGPLYVSFFTRDTAYEAEAWRLRASLLRLKLPHEIHAVDARGTWLLNIAHKAAFMAQMMRQHPTSPLVWLDADSEVLSHPGLFDELAMCSKPDFAAHWFRGTELLAGAMYFGPTTDARRLVTDWDAECRAHPKLMDQECLQALVDRTPALRIARLPAEYVWMRAEDGKLDISEAEYGKRQPVIVQRQASRRLADSVGGKRCLT